MVSVTLEDELVCLDCARDALLFCLSNDIECAGLESQVQELERRKLVRIGPFEMGEA